MRVLLTALNIIVRKPFPKTYDVDQWRLLFISVVQGSPVALDHDKRIFADFPNYDFELVKLSVDGLKKLLDRCVTADSRLTEQIQSADDHISTIARLHSSLDLSLQMINKELERDSNHYQACLQRSRHLQDTSDIELQKLLFERIQEYESKKYQLLQQKTHSSVLLQAAYNIHDSMVRYLESERSDFDRKVRPIIQSLAANMSWSNGHDFE